MSIIEQGGVYPFPPDEGPQPPTRYSASQELRWMLSPTPGERPRLQQKWICEDTEAVVCGAAAFVEWRDVPFVDWNERSVV